MKCSVIGIIPALLCGILFTTACGSTFSGTTEESTSVNTGIKETSTLHTTVPISQTTATIQTTVTAATTTTELQTTVTDPPTETISTVQPAERYADTPTLQVAFLVNMEREKYGLPPLMYSDKLGEMAQLRANELLAAFGHTRPDGRSCFSIFDDYQISYRAIAENIAAGQETPDVAIEWWMNSEIHRNNILNPDFRYIGVGNVTQDGVQYWTQSFADADGLDGYIVVQAQ